MKKFFFGFSFSVFIFFLLSIFPRNAFAQVCTGDSGAPGQCAPAMTCPPARIDGQGSCPGDPLTGPICCLDEGPPSGTKDCGDACSSDDECLSSLSCSPSAGICTGGGCPLCTGNSGYFGACLPINVCAGKGRTNDGVSSCTLGSICCTEAPTSETCSLTSPGPFLVGAEFPVNLTTSTPNTNYTVTTSPAGCLGTCQGVKTTNSSGNVSCLLACGPPQGTYTLTARSGSINCSLNINALNEPGVPCTGVSTGQAGYCVAGFICPQNYYPDGKHPQVCNIDGQMCCVYGLGYSDIETPIFCKGNNAGDTTTVNTGKLATAIGCIPIRGGQEMTAFILGWAIGIAGGIAFILIIVAAFQIITSSGDPKKLQAGRELLTSAIAGLLLLIFSVFILRIIGVKLLGIPGFG